MREKKRKQKDKRELHDYHVSSTRFNFQITNTVKFERKRVDDVLGGESAWEGAAQTTGAFIENLLHAALMASCLC